MKLTYLSLGERAMIQDGVALGSWRHLQDAFCEDEEETTEDQDERVSVASVKYPLAYYTASGSVSEDSEGKSIPIMRQAPCWFAQWSFYKRLWIFGILTVLSFIVSAIGMPFFGSPSLSLTLVGSRTGVLPLS